MKKVLIDAWGRPAYNSNYRNAANRPAAYMVATSGAATYVCFSADDERVIQRISTADGVTTIMFAFGAWANRGSLEYGEINMPIGIDADKVAAIYVRV